MGKRGSRLFIQNRLVVQRKEFRYVCFRGNKFFVISEKREHRWFEIAYELFSEKWHSFWTPAMADMLKFNLSNNLAEAIHAGLHRICPKRERISTVDWTNRCHIIADKHNETWAVLVSFVRFVDVSLSTIRRGEAFLLQVIGCENSSMLKFQSYLIQRESDRRWSRVEGHTVEGKRRKYKFKSHRYDNTKKQKEKAKYRQQKDGIRCL